MSPREGCRGRMRMRWCVSRLASWSSPRGSPCSAGRIQRRKLLQVHPRAPSVWSQPAGAERVCAGISGLVGAKVTVVPSACATIDPELPPRPGPTALIAPRGVGARSGGQPGSRARAREVVVGRSDPRGRRLRWRLCAARGWAAALSESSVTQANTSAIASADSGSIVPGEGFSGQVGRVGSVRCSARRRHLSNMTAPIGPRAPVVDDSTRRTTRSASDWRRCYERTHTPRARTVVR